jgi:hypothetical protein
MADTMVGGNMTTPPGDVLLSSGARQVPADTGWLSGQGTGASVAPLGVLAPRVAPRERTQLGLACVNKFGGDDGNHG